MNEVNQVQPRSHPMGWTSYEEVGNLTVTTVDHARTILDSGKTPRTIDRLLIYPGVYTPSPLVFVNLYSCCRFVWSSTLDQGVCDFLLCCSSQMLLSLCWPVWHI